MDTSASPLANCTVGVICLSHNRGGMERDAVRIARLLGPSVRVVLVVRQGSYLDELRASIGPNKGIISECVSFRSNYSLRLIRSIREILLTHRVTHVICLGNSELKSLRIAFRKLRLGVIVRHVTRKNRAKRDVFHRWIYRGVSLHVVNSKDLEHNVRAIFPVDESRIRLIYPSVRAPLISSYRQPDSVVRIVHVGRLSPGKGQDAAIRACRRIADAGISFELTLVGDAGSPYAQTLISLVRSAQLGSAIRLTGHVEDVFPYLLSADIFLFPSAGEGLSNAFAEALCVGLVPIVYDNTSFREIFELGFHGHLVPDQDEDALAMVLQRVCRQLDEEKRRAFANIRLARTVFSEERERREYLESLRETSPPAS